MSDYISKLSLLLVVVLTTTASAFVPHPLHPPPASLAFAEPSPEKTALFGVPKDKFDMEELRLRLASSSTSGSSAGATSASATTQKKKRQPPPPHEPETNVHCVFFQNQQGIHTVERKDGDNVVLAFESPQACDKFAAELKEQQFFDPTPQEVNLDSLEALCDKLGVLVQLVPEDVDVIAPKKRVPTLGRPSRLRQQLSSAFYDNDQQSAVEEGVVLSSSTADSCWE